jgi:putative membrane protein
VKPLFVFASAPLLLLTLGLFLLVINSLLLWLTSWIADQLNLGWHVDGFWSAFWGALIVSVVSFILNSSFISKSEVNR